MLCSVESACKLATRARTATTGVIAALCFSDAKARSQRGMTSGLVDLGPDALVVLITKEDRPDHHRDQSDDDRKGEPSVDVAGARHQARGDDGQKTAEPAVAEVVGQRERCVPDLRWEGLDQKRRDRS